MSRLLIILGIVLVLLGLLWPYLEKSGLGKLPGDILIKRENFTFYFPVTTGLLASIVLTLLFALFKR